MKGRKKETNKQTIKNKNVGINLNMKSANASL